MPFLGGGGVAVGLLSTFETCTHRMHSMITAFFQWGFSLFAQYILKYILYILYNIINLIYFIIITMGIGSPISWKFCCYVCHDLLCFVAMVCYLAWGVSPLLVQCLDYLPVFSLSVPIQFKWCLNRLLQGLYQWSSQLGLQLHALTHILGKACYQCWKSWFKNHLVGICGDTRSHAWDMDDRGRGHKENHSVFLVEELHQW